MIIAAEPRRTTEQTGPQVLFPEGGLYSGWGLASKPRQCGEAWWRKVRKMRIEPTIAFLSQKFRADVVRPGFSIVAKEGVGDEMKDFARQKVAEFYDDMARDASRGCIDFGYQGFEVVYTEKDGMICFDHFKPLLHEVTQILIYSDTGEFAGFLQDFASYYPSSPLIVTLNQNQCMHVGYNVEGTNWYGRPIMLNVEEAYDSKQIIETNATEYDGRVAAAHWAVYYPPGENPIVENGEETGEYEDNKTIALGVLRALLSTGSAVIPSEVEKKIEELGDNSDSKSTWRIELLTAARTSGAPYNERLKYKDTEFARGFGYAERAVFEGQFGTKAESEVHAEGSMGGPQEVAITICHALSMQVLPNLMEYNYGPEYRNSVYCVANPTTDTEMAYMKALYDKLITQGEIALSEYDAIDMFQLGEMLNIPYRPEEEIEAEREEMQEKMDEQMQQESDDEADNDGEEETNEPDESDTGEENDDDN